MEKMTEIQQIEFDCFVYNTKKAWLSELSYLKKEILTWSKEEDIKEFAKQAKKRFCEASIEILEEALTRNRKLYKEICKDETAHWMLAIIEENAADIKKRIRKYKTTIEYQNSGRSDFIDDYDIARAKEYPIEQIVEIGHNKRAKCVFHNGEDFNMGIKNNIARCFVCGEWGDSIKVYQSVHGCGFVEAVRALS